MLNDSPVRPPPGRSLVTASLLMTAATVAFNLLSYVLAAVGTRVLGPQGYGDLAALLGLLLVGNVPALTLQVVVARRIAAGEPGGLGRAVVVTTAAVALVGALASPILGPVLRLPTAAVVLLVVTLIPLTVVGALMGAVQGAHRFGGLAAICVVMGIGRSGGAMLAVSLYATATSAMAGMAIGMVATAAVSAVLVGPGVRRALTTIADGAAVVREVGRAAATMLAAVAITTVDVLLAQRYLPPGDAGLYGAAAVVTKVALWLPQAVTQVAVPRFAVATHRRDTLRVSVAVLAGLGIVEVVGILLVGPSLFRLTVGPGYEGVNGLLWLFAAEGALLAIAQLVIVSRVAATDRLIGPLIWGGLVAEIVLVSVLPVSITVIAVIATATATLIAAAGLLLPIQAAGRGTGQPTETAR
ncbi:lipopolysaccharide biosynthesis protein [Actinokineospora sp.]|uniref:lipopolysaccharide biosynthesis protein n=1 Tax=Actinokineospora sp. TaxID=1872133 RepID=UPI0040382618